MNIQRVLIIGLAFLMVQACQTDFSLPSLRPITAFKSLNEQPLIRDYYPLKAGRRWTYSLKQYQNGKLKDNNRFREMHMEVKQLNRSGDSLQAVLQRSYTYAPDMVPNPTLAKAFDNRIELSRYQPQLMDTYPQLNFSNSQAFLTILQLPFEVGHSWQGRARQETVYIRGFETVKTPAGTFKALKTNHQLKYDDGRENNLYYWYVKDIGMVKLYEEATLYFGEWIHVKSEGQLTAFN